jgi:tetrahydromethanopterin S-methyltransferase subunit G
MIVSTYVDKVLDQVETKVDTVTEVDQYGDDIGTTIVSVYEIVTSSLIDDTQNEVEVSTKIGVKLGSYDEATE